MRTYFAAAAVGMLQTAFADYIILPPPATATGEDTAIVWIHGADCDNDAYVTFVNEIQSQGGQKGQKLWVGLPEFVLSTPEPILIDHYVTETISKLRSAGFTGDNILLAGHSLGGVMV